jgi:predicted AAA+ superfamily ATPase
MNINRLVNIPKQSFFLFGPRGTGKTTFIKNVMGKKALYIDLLEPDTFRLYSAYPETLIKVIKGQVPDTVIIDEVQKVPEILEVVHKLIEEEKIQFVLTGSSARKLKKTGANLLGGRAFYCKMHPFVASELKEQFSLEAALMTGLIPVIVMSSDRSRSLSAYVDVYLKEEIAMEGFARNLGAFNRFLEVVSFSHAGILNVSNVSRECQIERRVIAGYLEILEDLLLAYRIPVFTRRAKRKTSVHPKFYFYDAGLYRRLRQRGPLDTNDEIHGPALEGLVGQHLRAYSDYSLKSAGLFFWHSAAGNEVDFILYGDETFIAIEVKNTSTANPHDFHGLYSFGDEYPEAKLILLYRGKELYKHKNILVIPCYEFLLNIDKYCASSGHTPAIDF